MIYDQIGIGHCSLFCIDDMLTPGRDVLSRNNDHQSSGKSGDLSNGTFQQHHSVFLPIFVERSDLSVDHREYLKIDNNRVGFFVPKDHSSRLV